MARPGLFRHRKFARLTRAVKSPALAVGALELMWNACYESCDDRIGTAEDIVFAIRWAGRIDIVAALHDAGFIDEDGAHPGVYVVHDLWDHAPQYVLRRREREDKRESDGTTTRHRINARRQKLDTDKPLSSHEQAADKPLTSTPGTERYVSVQSVSEQGASEPSEAQKNPHAPTIKTATNGTPVTLTDPPSDIQRLHEHWRDEASTHGVIESLILNPKAYSQLKALLAVHPVDALCRAVTSFWGTGHFDGKRQIGMFAANAPQLVAHVASGATHPFGTRLSAEDQATLDFQRRWGTTTEARS